MRFTFLFVFEFLEPDLSPLGYKNECFFVTLSLLIEHETGVGRSDQQAFQSVVKNTAAVLNQVKHVGVPLKQY